MEPRLPSFPSTFRFGVATAAAQIEGGGRAHGKGESNWECFAERPEAIYEGHDLAVASHHLDRLDEDLDWLAALGVDCYRFSLSFPRVLPEGRGHPNEAGLAFYDRLIDGLLERGILPYSTLFHWDLPQALEREGGFLRREIVEDFERYAELVARRFGDRVKHFLTINEPHAFIEGGLAQGRHAPGHRLPAAEVLRAAHHALLCHGRMTRVLRGLIPNVWITSAPVLVTAIPATSTNADIEAAREYTWTMRSSSLRVSSFWMDPMYLGRYPESAYRIFGKAMPDCSPADLAEISAPLDACGVNLYDAVVVRANASGEPEVLHWPPGTPRTAFGWPVTPDAHEWGPRFSFERYGKPIFVTENGLSCRDWVHLDGEVRDPDRIDFIERHLAALARANVPLEGYFHWSLLDNFEWNHGYRERFGLIFVDFETGKRTPKSSFFAYRDLIARHRS